MPWRSPTLESLRRAAASRAICDEHMLVGRTRPMRSVGAAPGRAARAPPARDRQGCPSGTGRASIAAIGAALGLPPVAPQLRLRMPGLLALRPLARRGRDGQLEGLATSAGIASPSR
jgi:hypothetical protein